MSDHVDLKDLQKRAHAISKAIEELHSLKKNVEESTKGFLLHADYSRKTEELARERKAMKKQHDEIMTKMAALQERLKAYESCEKEIN